ncbi:MAG TPA: hypothetical protein ENK96_08130 [Desulfobulbaceae bacterium]|nr:hypothetical protein [Desulfobulbaceae bacterium]
MKNKTVLIFYIAAILFTTTSLRNTPSVWSAPGGTKQVGQEATEKNILNLEESTPGKKGKKTVKKKVVKKAGTAAVVGMIGTKVTSKVKKSIKGSEK